MLLWAVCMSLYNYECLHISVDDNELADLMTHWTIPSTTRRLVTMPPLPSTFTDFEWRTFFSLRYSKDAYDAHLPAADCEKDGLLRQLSGSLWIPDLDDGVQLRLCIITHTGDDGNRSATSTAFSWSKMSEGVDLFVSSCIHCLSTKGGVNAASISSCHLLHKAKRVGLVRLHLIGPKPHGLENVLMVLEDHSGNAWFYSASNIVPETAANALLDCSAAFGRPMGLMSDRPANFKNEPLRLLAKCLRSPHHFTLPYCRWSNGTVERLGKELLLVESAVLSELQMPHDDWPQLVPLFDALP